MRGLKCIFIYVSMKTSARTDKAKSICANKTQTVQLRVGGVDEPLHIRERAEDTSTQPQIKKAAGGYHRQAGEQVGPKVLLSLHRLLSGSLARMVSEIGRTSTLAFCIYKDCVVRTIVHAPALSTGHTHLIGILSCSCRSDHMIECKPRDQCRGIDQQCYSNTCNRHTLIPLPLPSAFAISGTKSIRKTSACGSILQRIIALTAVWLVRGLDVGDGESSKRARTPGTF